MRRLILAILLVTIVLPTQSVKASPTAEQMRPLAWNNQGRLTVMAYLGSDDGKKVNPMHQPVQVKICTPDECHEYSALSGNAWEGYSGHYWRSIGIELEERHKDVPITAQIPLDLVSGTKGWSRASDPVTVETNFDPLAFFKQQISRPPIAIVYSAINPTGMTRVDLCMNYRESFNVSMLYKSIHFGLDISRHKSIRYELFQNGVLKKSQNFQVRDAYGNSYIPGCDTGTLGSSLMTSIDGLIPGKSYELIYTLTDELNSETTATLDFVTPGACPTGNVVLAPSPRTFHYGVLDDSGVLVSYLSFHWHGTDLPPRLAPIFHSGSKIIPFRGNLTEIRSSSERWTFLRDIEEWALVLDDAVPQVTSDVLAHTVFANCRSTQTTTNFSLDESTVSAQEQGCTISNNKIIPVKPGVCMVDVSITARKVKSSAARPAKPTLISMNYVISKVAKTKKLQNKASVTFRSKAAKGSVLTSASLLSPSKGARVTRVTTRTSSICRAQGTSLRMLQKGKCRYTATVVRKGKPSTVSSVIRVR
jgi:hypothetical protein